MPSVQKTFTRSVFAGEGKPVYEVYRNGIMHGMITDYDNDVAASKAWCMLFAVGDWVDSRIRGRKKVGVIRYGVDPFVDIRGRNQRSRFRQHDRVTRRRDLSTERALCRLFSGLVM